METIRFLEELKENKVSILRIPDIKKIICSNNNNTVYKFVERTIKKNLILRLKNGIYLYKNSSVNDFEIANQLYFPSYISLESALNFYGILSQFPYIITSVTPKKTKKVISQGKTYEYVHFEPKYFTGYMRQSSFLIADREKALFDILYLIAKGIKRISLDELDLSSINKKILDKYIKQTNFLPLKKLYKQIL